MKPDTRAFYLDAVHRVVAHLVTHLDESPDLAALARLAGLSPFHFHRVFRGMVGETPLELLRRLRLERAAHQLRHDATTVTAVAFNAGYETHEAFTRAFRAAFGAAPSVFRQNARAHPRLAASSGLHFDPCGTATDFIPRDAGGQTMQIDRELLPPLRLGTITHIGPYNRIGAAYADDPDGKAADELVSYAGMTIPDGVPLPDGLVEQRVQGGAYARYIHMGAYDVLGDVWTRFLGEALPANGFVLKPGLSLEIYRSDMRTTPPAQWRTDLLVPVE
jgi:AraC family transcriptional regulator